MNTKGDQNARSPFNSPESTKSSSSDTSFQELVRYIPAQAIPRQPTTTTSPPKETYISSNLKQELQRLRPRIPVSNHPTFRPANLAFATAVQKVIFQTSTVEHLPTASTMASQPHVGRIPKFDRADHFSGEMAAELWLDRVNYYFETDEDADQSASTYIRAISILLQGEAGNRFRSNPRMRTIIKNRATAGETEKQEVIEWLQKQYPFEDELVEEEIDVMAEVNALQQGAQESLSAYYARTAELLKKTGGKDLDRVAVPMQGPMPYQKDSDRYILQSITSAFVRGIRDEKLRSHALSSNVLLLPCLWKAYEILCLSQSALKGREKIEAEIQKQRYYEDMERYIETTAGRPASVAIAEIQQKRYAAEQRTQDKHDFPTPAFQSLNQYRLPNQPSTQFGPPWQNRSQAYKPSSQGFYNHGSNNNQNQFPMRSAAQNWDNRQKNNFQSRNNTSLRPASESRNPYINGSQSYSREINGVLCIDCGDLGHIKQDCKAEKLPDWERAYLRALVFPEQTVYAHHLELQKSYTTDPIMFSRQDARSSSSSSADCTTPASSRYPSFSSSGGSATMSLQQYSDLGYKKAMVEDVTESLSAKMGELGSLKYHASQEGESPLVNVFMADRRAKKRARPSTESSDEVIEVQPRTKNTAQKKGEKKLRQLREIVGREGKGPMDYTELASKFEVTINLLELFQLSPEVSKQFRKLSTRRNEQKSKKTAEAEAASSTPLRSNLAQVAPHIHPDDKAWKVPVSLRITENSGPTIVDLPIGMSAADQGSDIVLMTPALQQKLRLPLISLNSKGYAGVSYGTADGVMHRLEHFVSLEIGIKGIWRKLDAFVRPASGTNDTELSLLLGLPWMHAVDAKLNICKSILTIGGNIKEEKPVTIQGPLFEPQPSSHLNLVLHPKIKSKRSLDNLTVHFRRSDSTADEVYSDISTTDDEGATDSESEESNATESDSSTEEEKDF